MAWDLTFRNVYWSSNGSQIIEVTHESSKEVDDRVHPVSYMAFINLPTTAKVGESFPVDISRLWRDEPQFWANAEACEPLTGFYHDTYWSAKAAIEMDGDPSGILDTFEKVARDERNMLGLGNVQRIGAKRFDPLLKAIEESKALGKLPLQLQATPGQAGGGAMWVEITYKGIDGSVRAPEAFWMSIQDCFYGVAICQYWYEGPDNDDPVEVLDGDNVIDIAPNVEDNFEGEWDLEHPQCIAAVVRTLENLHRFGVKWTEMLPHIGATYANVLKCPDGREDCVLDS